MDFVSANWFEELGFGPASGRVLHPEIDEKPGAPPVIVISHDFWQSRFGGDPAVVGKTVRLNNRSATVIGVASARFPNMRLRSFHAWMAFPQMNYFSRALITRPPVFICTGGFAPAFPPLRPGMA